MKRNVILGLIIIMLFPLSVKAQKQYKIATIAFYNVENLFDTVSSIGYIDGTRDFQSPEFHKSIALNSKLAETTEVNKRQLIFENLEGKQRLRKLVLADEYTPEGGNNWNTEKYYNKLEHIAEVILSFGKEKNMHTPVIMGLSELENEHVIRDITQQKALKELKYDYVHFNSFDERGIDVGLIYQKDRFMVTEKEHHPLILFDRDGRRDYTRDILHVGGYLDGEKIHILVNHWPSRSGGASTSEPKREKAGDLARKIVNDILKKEPGAKIILMGDFNDGPTNSSIKKHLRTTEKLSKANDSILYNPMENMARRGAGTAAYRDSWEVLDQLILSHTLLGKDYSSYKLLKAQIHKKSFLTEKSGARKGYPFRTYKFGVYENGYSDHFPVYLNLIKEK
ncbi:MAG: endonuclease/exonuclease/phosphatase family protein [Flavobacteriales bacterium]